MPLIPAKETLNQCVRWAAGALVLGFCLATAVVGVPKQQNTRGRVTPAVLAARERKAGRLPRNVARKIARTVQAETPLETETASSLVQPQPERGTRAALMQEHLRPGEPLTVGLMLADSPADSSPDSSATQIRAILSNTKGERLSQGVFFCLEPEDGLWAAVLAIPSLAMPGSASIKVERGTELLGEIPFTINSRDFVAEEIALNPSNTAIRTEPDPQKTAEASRLWAILNRTGTEIYGGDVFSPPLTITRRTSFFGDRRVYRYSNGKSDTAVHAGIDYGAPLGTAVSACAPGKVVLAQFRIVTGYSVIIEHLPGLYSLYYHLDKIHIDEGALVNTGTLLGESGATGLATGPHLHWEIRAAGENADPDAFMAGPILDKAAILSKLSY